MVARLLIDKPNLVQLELRPVKPDVEAHRLGTVVGRRNRQPIGLDAAVCARDVTAYHVTGFLRPRRPAGLELFRAREAVIEHLDRLWRVILRRKFLWISQDE